MNFTPRTTIPDPMSSYYRLYTYGDGGYDRFGWITEYPQGNCTGYAYGRFGEECGMDLHNDFLITQSPGNGKQWIYNSWPDQTFTSGSIDLKLGDILVWGGGTYGHVEIVEAIYGATIMTSYSIYASTYAEGCRFRTRTISYPTWSSVLGTWIDNAGNSHTYTNPFIGYIHNKYITPSTFDLAALLPHFRKRHKRLLNARR